MSKNRSTHVNKPSAEPSSVCSASSASCSCKEERKTHECEDTIQHIPMEISQENTLWHFLIHHWHTTLFFILTWLIGTGIMFQQHYSPHPITETELETAFTVTAQHSYHYTDSVTGKTTEIKQGESIISPTPEEIDHFRQYQNESSIHPKDIKNSFFTFWNHRNILRVLLLGMLLFCFEYCLYKMHIFQVNMIQRSSIAALLLILEFLVLAFLKSINFTNGYSSVLLISMTPLSFFTVITCHLMGGRAAVCMAILTAILFPLQMNLPGLQIQSLYYALFVNILGLLSFQNAKHRKDFLYGGLILTAVIAITTFIYAFDLDRLGIFAENILRILLFSCINGMGTAILSIAVLPALEWIFNVMTPMSLMELADLNSPLLQKLQQEAPGTYQHSQNVCRLAERAAYAINANVPLVRTMTLYHDIGKLRSPHFFAENLTAGAANPHDDLDPIDSCNVLREHGSYESDLANKYHLGRLIRPAIEQHHGSSLMMFFYNKACRQAQAAGQPLPAEESFRYPGLPPSSKEVVIISLADACEAAVRSMQNARPDLEQQLQEVVDYVVKTISNNPKTDNKAIVQTLTEIYRNKQRSQLTEKDISALVGTIIDSKWRDHQLDMANITTQELAKVRSTFVQTFMDMYHFRPTYSKDAIPASSAN